MTWIGWWLLSGCAAPAGVLTIETRDVAALGTTYEISTYLPPDAVRGPGAPWVLLLDGDAWAVHAAIQLDEAVRRGDALPMVIVGVGNQATRDRDYLPPLLDGTQDTGIEAFFDWVADDLIPEREATLGIGGDRAQRVLVGHSYGGLAATWALSHRTAVWGGYGLVSPSVWWDEGAALTWDADLTGARIHVVYGALEEPSLLSLAHQLAGDLGQRGDAEVTERVFAGDDHYTVARERAFGDVFGVLP